VERAASTCRINAFLYRAQVRYLAYFPFSSSDWPHSHNLPTSISASIWN